MHGFASAHGVPTSLRQLGLRETDIERAADLAVANPYWNPRPLEHAAMVRLLRRAYEGLAPEIE
jgi:alcohol dehydrogenase class IV